jgi:uncharacterized protein (DUF2384 family)
VLSVGNLLPKVVDSVFNPKKSATSEPEIQHPLNARWCEIIEEAAKILGDEKRVVHWLHQAKVTFGNKTPLEMLGTDEGCDAVLKLLRDIWK